MAQALGQIDWLKDDPDLIRHFRQTEVDGVVLYVADCVAYTEQQLGLDEPEDERPGSTSRAATRNDRPRWRDGVVPYRFMSNFTAAEERIFLNAAEMWTSGVGRNSDNRPTVLFVDDARRDFPSYLRVSKGGPTNEASNGAVSTAYLKIAVFDAGSIAHEMGHVLGLVHEHQRSDRDHYVSVLPAVSGNPNFRCHGASEDTIRTDYDFGSIMHYGRKVMLGGQAVDALLPKPDYTAQGSRMGQRSEPSRLDLQAVRQMYAR